MFGIEHLLLPIIQFFYNIIPNYGVAIILFTIVIKAALSPLDLKSRRSMKRMADLNPKLEAIKKKYANDQEKLNAKTAELYKAEKINPLSGCLPMLLTMPILFAMFAAMRIVANDQLVAQYLQLSNGVVPKTEGFLWIQNLWMPDSFAKSIMPDFASLQGIGKEVWERVSGQLAASGTIPQALQFVDTAAFTSFIQAIPQHIADNAIYTTYLETVPGLTNINMLLFSLSIFKQVNGYFILPILAVVSQYVSQKLSTAGNPNAANANASSPTASTNKMMTLIFPLMSLLFCATSSSAFAIYWVVSNLIAAAQQVAFNKYFAWQDRKAAIAQEVGTK